MSRRIFVTVTRGMTDKTAICVFPWEVDILSLVHGQEIKEVSIDEMCRMDGAVRVEKQKLKKLPGMRQSYAPDLRAQLEAMVYVDPDEDPANDPMGEYGRMVEKYGMDKEFPVACVERVYGRPESGAFEAKLKEFAEDRAAVPAALKAQQDEEVEKSPSEMSRQELRDALTERGIAWKATEGRDALVEKLTAELVE